MRVAVVTDSGSGMSLEQGLDTGIYVLPLQVKTNTSVKLEGETITNDEVYRLLASGERVDITLPPMDKIESLFTELKEQYDMIFAVPICNSLTNVLSAMQQASEKVGIPLEYIECYSAFSNQLYLVQSAKTLFDDGKSVEEVKERLQDAILDNCTMIIMNDLNHMVRGGKISSAWATVGELLKIKPILYLNKSTAGRLDSFAHAYTMQKAMEECISRMIKQEVTEDYLLTVGHVADDDSGRYFLRRVRTEFPRNEVLYRQLTSIIGAHMGIGCIVLQYIKRINMD